MRDDAIMKLHQFLQKTFYSFLLLSLIFGKSLTTLAADEEIPEIARGYEDIYHRFIGGKLIYKPNEYNDVDRVEISFSSLSNPLEGTFNLSSCGSTGQFLSIATG